MTNEENPYRFVDVSNEEQALEDPGWDLRDYVEPAEEPIFGPDEILTLGERWSGFLLWTLIFQAISLCFVCLMVPPTQTGSRPGVPPPRSSTDMKFVALAAIVAIAAQVPPAAGAYRLARALRGSRLRSAAIGAIYVVPLLNFVLLAALGYLAMRTLWRHGIRTDIFAPHSDSLPRAAE